MNATTQYGVSLVFDNEAGSDKFRASLHFFWATTAAWLLRRLAAGIGELDQAPAEDGILARRAEIDGRCGER